MLEDWLFVCLAVLDIYEITEQKSSYLIDVDVDSPTHEIIAFLERKICLNDPSQANKNLSDIFLYRKSHEKIYWRCRIELTETLKIKFLVPEILASSILIDQFGENRSLKCTIKYDVSSSGGSSSPKKQTPQTMGMTLKFDSRCARCKNVMVKGDYVPHFQSRNYSNSTNWKFYCPGCSDNLFPTAES